jgi:bifunctional N-acetylglucosamine-1-phosphate-uridyltransferase/glucosamine-1-phosphate-acetyltransferase GlmU-like protein
LVKVGNYQNTKTTKFVQNEKVGNFVELVKNNEIGEEQPVSKKEFIF